MDYEGSRFTQLIYTWRARQQNIHGIWLIDNNFDSYMNKSNTIGTLALAVLKLFGEGDNYFGAESLLW